jgi:hypothetical protein
LICTTTLALLPHHVMAQEKPAPPPTQNTVPAPPKVLPFATQLRKVVVLIQSYCEVDKQPNDPPNVPEKRVETASGTGFLVALPHPASPDKVFQYLVTNRHVAEPGIEDGKPCKLLGSMAIVNPKDQSAPLRPMTLPVASWVYPEDDGVDLAAMPFGIDGRQWDIENIPLSMFVDDATEQNNGIVEGDPVIFSGLFIQFAGIKRFEPIVREGRVAMIPSDKVIGTLKKPASAYLTEAHSYGGNSGSPMFVNLGGFRNGSMIVGDQYKFLGVVAGGYHEGADFTLNVATTYKGQAEANSGVSLIVPASEVRALLLNRQFQQQRDDEVRHEKQSTK